MDGQLKQEIQDLMTKVLEIFTKEYTTNYTIGLVDKSKDEAKKEPSPYQLLSRPDSALDKSDLYKGYLTKEGGFRKSWKKRYFCIRYDYSIDYYVDENEANKQNGSKKGSINLSGYKLNKDPNKSKFERLKKLAEKMGIDVSEVPKGKEYPPHTIELHHPNRRTYYLTATSEEECKAWRKKLKKCIRYAWGLKNRDPVHMEAFHVAVRNTRWALGRYGWWSYGGNEYQVLTDIITDELEYDIIGRMLYKLPKAPYAIRNFLRKQMMKTLDTMTSAAVNPAWTGMEKSVQTARPVAEPKIKESVDPIFKVEDEIMNKMREGLMSIIDPALKEHVIPHAGKIIKMVRNPIHKGFAKSFEIWEKAANGYDGDGKSANSFYFLDYVCYREMYEATKEINPLREDLETLRHIFSDISPYWICYDIKEVITQVAKKANYTFEHTVVKDEAHDIGRGREETLEKYRHDIEIHHMEQIQYSVKAVVKEPFLKIVNPLCRPVISSLASLVPSPLTDFCNINEMFDKFIDDVINDVIETCMKEE